MPAVQSRSAGISSTVFTGRAIPTQLSVDAAGQLSSIKLPFDELDLVMILTDFEAEYDLDIEMPDVDDEEDYFRHHGEWLDLLGRYIETLGEDD